MNINIKGTIVATSNSKHPDCKAGTPLSFTDTYTVDMNYFNSKEDVYRYIRRDLGLVLGGGYSTDTIDNVIFNLIEM